MHDLYRNTCLSLYRQRLPYVLARVLQVTLYIYDYITQSCRQQAEVIQDHENDNVCYIGQGEAQHRKYKRFKLGGGHL
jgi:hypothetical protein